MLIFRLKQIVRRYPSLYFNLLGKTSRIAKLRAYPDSDLVIEGFPRSANTSSVYTFLHAQNNAVKLGHHLHVVAHVKFAVRHKIPCLVISRKPIDCVASLMVMRAGGNPRKLLCEYIDFTREINKLRKDIVIVSFSSVVDSGLGFAIRLVNERFGTHFTEPNGSYDEKEWVKKQIISWNNKHSGGNKERLSFPSLEKKGLSDIMKNKVLKASDLLDKANRLYNLSIK